MVLGRDLFVPSGGKPGFNLCKIPDDTAGSEGEPARELATLLHLVNRRVAERHDLFKLMSSDRPRQIVSSSLRHPDLHLHVQECRRSSAKEDVAWRSSAKTGERPLPEPGS